LDTTEEVIEEALKLGCNLIVSHHPIIFKGLKKLTGSNYVQRTVLKSIRNNIAIYTIHTNLDNVSGGVNDKICQQLGLIDTEILLPKSGTLSKLVTFIPKQNAEKVLKSLFNSGVGEIGEYDHCSFTIDGIGTFRPGQDASPIVGKAGKNETVHESRVEVIFPSYLWPKVKRSLINAHPYDEAAYYLTGLDNDNNQVGSGMVGNLPTPMDPAEFLSFVKERMDTPLIRHTEPPKGRKVEKIAVCGGSGSFLIPSAVGSGADVFITGDVKYHEFFDADGKIMIADIGHYESEAFTKDLLHDLLTKKFNTFALHLSKTVTNPINYF
ncbi:MAG: Nif3-like dinuclear metal center hexameric protein, partial [Saprospiraceae bacterium]|nr:Nif3-like dinuclear metal center hexameric protein [Saprospiraceae bacterium]